MGERRVEAVDEVALRPYPQPACACYVGRVPRAAQVNGLQDEIRCPGCREGALDADGLRACIAARGGLDQLSRERVRMELVKLLVAPRAAGVLEAMADSGLLGTLLAGVPNGVHFSAMVAIEGAMSLQPNAMRRLVAVHGIFAFFFNTVIVAAAVNIAVALAH